LDKPIFLAADPHQEMTARNFAYVLARVGEKLGLSPEQSKPYCLKISAITIGALAGLPPDQMQMIGDHKSASYKKYIKPALVQRGIVLASVLPAAALLHNVHHKVAIAARPESKAKPVRECH
jgi:hypothetical protein